MRSVIRIGTRGSLLALAQAREVRKKLAARFPKFSFELVVVRTEGDEFQSVELFKENAVGVFTKAIEEKLIHGEIDLAVHSLKDVPAELPKGLILAAFPKRLDRRDVLISRRAWTLETLPPGARVGTGSPRRKRQLALARPDVELCDVRGNLDTRAAKVLKKKDLDAIVVAHAGLLRIRKYIRYARLLPVRTILPAAGQGALGLEVRADDERILKAAKTLNDPATEKEVSAERCLLSALQGGCRVPVGIDSRARGGKLYLKASVFSPDTPDYVTGEILGEAEDFRNLAEKLALDLLKRGAARFMEEARGT
ncbi:MAG: hydroxymethylbilane synthase [Candidatus Omnitrophica bacterium]|nr:hydroxymethylbilane synthase [Candidatus Omnitrophota bacterium]